MLHDGVATRPECNLVKMPSRADCEASVCARLSQAKPVPFKSVSLPDWQPEVGACHCNMDRWVEANPGAAAVRGWVAHTSYRIAIGLKAHSVVRDQDGQLFDLTPLVNEYYRKTMRFIPHRGDDQLFFATQKLDNDINCPCELNWPDKDLLGERGEPPIRIPVKRRFLRITGWEPLVPN